MLGNCTGINRHPCATIRADGCLLIAIPYMAGVIERLKSEIPASERRYDSATQTWLVRRDCADRALRLLSGLLPDLRITFGGSGR